MNKKLMIIAGEVSGDLHGASLIEELKKLDPVLDIYGIGGDRMQAAGMNLIYHINKMAFLGFIEVVRHIPFIKKVQRDLISVIKEKKIKNVVLIDYPGFNLSIAKKLKLMNLNIVYYISPQIWAWGAGRIKKIKRLVNKMLVVFPFEENIYKEAGVEVEFVGHPLLERINNYSFMSRHDFYTKFNLMEDKEILLVLPGSRSHEVEKLFPEVIKAAERIADKFNLQVAVACSPNINEQVFSDLSDKKKYTVVKGFTYELLKYAKLGIVKSGTSTLEAGLFELPMVIVYKTSYLTYLIGKNLIKVDNIGMANIIAGEKLVPELIQNRVNEDTIYKECEKILGNPGIYSNIKTKLKNIKEKLGARGASEKAAQIIYTALNES